MLGNRGGDWGQGRCGRKIRLTSIHAPFDHRRAFEASRIGGETSYAASGFLRTIGRRGDS